MYERTGMLGEKDTSCRREMMTSVKPKDTGIFQPTSAFDMISCLHTTDHIWALQHFHKVDVISHSEDEEIVRLEEIMTSSHTVGK